MSVIMQAKQQVKIAVMGYNADSVKYAKYYAEHPAIQLAGICDPRDDEAEEWSEHVQTTVFHNLPELLAEQKPDILHLALPVMEHLPDLYIAAEAGVHMICEKPMGLSATDMKQLAAICRQHSVQIIPSHEALFRPEYSDLARQVRAGVIGSPGVVHVRRMMTGEEAYGNPLPSSTAHRIEPMMTLFIEEIEFMSYLLGEVESVFAQHIRKERTEYALLTLKYECGTIVNMEGILGYPSPATSEFEMAGNQGIVRSRPKMSASVEIRRGNSPSAKYVITDSAHPKHRSEFRLVSPAFEDAIDGYIRSVLNMAAHKTEPIISLEASWKTAVVIQAAAYSASNGQAVTMRSFRLTDGWWRDA